MAWRSGKKILLLLLDDNLHKRFINYKKCNKKDKFYEAVGEGFSVSGSKIRDLLKNLGKEYRQVCQRMATSGVETEEKTLKGSTDIYQMFEKYQSLYYPKGSLCAPPEVVSEIGTTDVQRPNESKKPILIRKLEDSETAQVSKKKKSKCNSKKFLCCLKC